MKRLKVWGAVALLPIAAVALAQGTAKITPGLWETSTEIVDLQVKGLPANVPPEMMQRFKPAATTVRSCVTPQQAANPQAAMLAARKDGKCNVRKMVMTGGTMDIAMACTTPERGGTADIAMTGRYTPTSYTMDGAMKMDGANGMKITMKSRTTGKRVGDCKG